MTYAYNVPAEHTSCIGFSLMPIFQELFCILGFLRKLPPSKACSS
jgi:hypothetical protein